MENNITKKNIRILSSIPGRMRLKIIDFNKSDFFREKIIMFLSKDTNINTIKVNCYRNSILIFYDYNFLNEMNIIFLICKIDFNIININLNIDKNKNDLKKTILGSFKPWKIFKQHHDEDLYNYQNNVSKNLFKITVLISILALFKCYSIKVFLSILILGYPSFLFIITAAAWYISYKTAFINKIYLNSFLDFEKLNASESIAFDSSLLFNDTLHDNISYNKNNYSFNEIRSMINHNVYTLIGDLRNLGIINLKVLCKKLDYILKKAIYILGLDYVLITDKNMIKLNQESFNTFIIKYSNIYPVNKIYNNISIFIYDDNNSIINLQSQNIFIYRKNIEKISFLFNLIYHVHQSLIQVKSIAITINILGMLLIISGSINIFNCLTLYIFNILFSCFFLKMITNTSAN